MRIIICNESHDRGSGPWIQVVGREVVDFTTKGPNDSERLTDLRRLQSVIIDIQIGTDIEFPVELCLVHLESLHDIGMFYGILTKDPETNEPASVAVGITAAPNSGPNSGHNADGATSMIEISNVGGCGSAGMTNLGSYATEVVHGLHQCHGYDSHTKYRESRGHLISGVTSTFGVCGLNNTSQ